MNLSNAMSKIAAPLALVFAVSTGTPAFAHHVSDAPSNDDAFSCTRTDLAGLTKQDLVKKLLPATVLVNNKPGASVGGNGRMGPNGPSGRKGGGTGSGVVIDSDKGYIVTNNHVIKGNGILTVNIYDKDGLNSLGPELGVRLVGTDPDSDLAVLQITDKTAPTLPCIPLGDSSKVNILDDAIAIGSPMGTTFTVTAGAISGRDRFASNPFQSFLQTDTSINPGNSGGPLFNTNGEVIGINTQIISQGGGSVGLGFAIDMSTVRPVANSLISHGEVKRGWLGVVIGPVNEQIAEKAGLEDLSGVLIDQTTEGGPAGKGGLQKGDIITNISGHAIKDILALTRLVGTAPAGIEIDITVMRDGEEITKSITLDERKAAPPAPQNRAPAPNEGPFGEQQPPKGSPFEEPFGGQPEIPRNGAPEAAPEATPKAAPKKEPGPGTPRPF